MPTVRSGASTAGSTELLLTHGRASYRAENRDPKRKTKRFVLYSQPWYFTHEGDTVRVYCTQKGMESHMNRIDMGIVLAHLYVANEETFRFFKAENASDVPGYGYIGSITL